MKEGRKSEVTHRCPSWLVSGCVEQVPGMGTWVAATKSRRRAVELVRSLNY